MPGCLHLSVLSRLSHPEGPVLGGDRIALTSDPEAQRAFGHLVGARAAIAVLQSDEFTLVEIAATKIASLMITGDGTTAHISHALTTCGAWAGAELGLDDQAVARLKEAVRYAREPDARIVLQILPEPQAP